MTRKFIAAELGNIEGKGKQFVRATSDERQIEFFSGTVKNSEMHRCSLTKSANQSIGVGASFVSLTFDQETYDVGGLHNNITNNSRITIQEPGEYRIIYHIKHEGQDKILCESRILKNGSIVLNGTCDVSTGSKDASQLTLGSSSPLISFVQNDYIELQFVHDNASPQNVLADNTFFSIERNF